MNFRDALDKILKVTPCLDLKDAIALADVFSSAVDLTTQEGRVAFARDREDVMTALAAGQVIPAIKALRAATVPHTGENMSLWHAKQAVDEIRGVPLT